jgi:hypothetical protein
MLRTRNAFGLGALVLLLVPRPAAADLDPGLKEPYRLDVVLHFAEHRFLTPLFQEEVKRQLGDLLRMNFGELVQVRILDNHPLLKAITAKGLGPGLDGYETLSDTQIHFVLIDYEGGRYRLQARHHDGLTGLPAPVVHHEHTSDRRLVARLAARLVDHNFGLVGTVAGQDERGVAVALRGGALGVPLGRWLKPGDVLAVSRLSQEGDTKHAARLEWALLQVASAPDAGVCHCRYFHRYRDDHLQEGAGTLGYRCLRLATTVAPLRLRLMDDRDFSPLSGLQLQVSHTGFGEAGLELSTGADGLAVTSEPFAGVAFVQVLSGKHVRVRVPIEIVADHTVVCRMTVNEDASDRDRLELRNEHWLRRLYEELRLANDRVTRLNALVQPAPEEALKRARAGLAGVSRQIDALTLEHAELHDAATGQPGTALDLSEGEQRLRELREQRDQLKAFAGRLEIVIKEAQGPKARALQTMLENASLLERQADFEEALALYRKVLKESPEQSKVRRRLEELQAAWQTHGSDHEKARAFIYDSWPKKCDTAALKAALPQAWKAFRECEKVGDKLSPQKMLSADLAHAGSLKERLAILRRTPDREDARNETRIIAALAEDLRRLHAEISAYVRKK